VNAGAPDWDGGDFLAGVNPGRGDTPNNGLFLNRYELKVRNLKMLATRLSNIYDGTSTTILLSENCHKSYEPAGPLFPSRFTWLFGTEQQLGIVWVANVNPQPGDAIDEQERINRAADEVYDDDPVFNPNLIRFARPASNHPGGVNAAYADSHVDFLAEDIDYLVYQSLLTSHGRKCVDTRDWTANLAQGEPIDTFRKAPPLSDADF
jgi:prepilin-type processing-associated H-X9-DG protein